MKALENKAVAVTGAGQGLGEAYARLAAAEGAMVVVNDIARDQAERVVSAIRDAGGQASVKLADISTWSGAEDLVRYCVDNYGALDGFINNAALFQMATVLEETEQSLRRIVEVNVLGTAFCGYLALRQMLRQGRGSLINITSGAHAGMKSMSAYGGTKGAAASMTYAWALETAGTGVRVNAISPMADTRMLETRNAYNAAHDVQSPARKAITPESNAPLAVYLLSDLSAGVNGQVVRIQGSSLNLMTHPAAVHPGVQGEAWSVDSIRAAFDDQLRARQLPCGVQSYAVEIQNYPLPSGS